MVSEQGSAPSKRFGGDGKGMAKASISEETCFGFYDSRRVTRRASQFPNSFVVIGVRTTPLGWGFFFDDVELAPLDLTTVFPLILASWQKKAAWCQTNSVKMGTIPISPTDRLSFKTGSAQSHLLSCRSLRLPNSFVVIGVRTIPLAVLFWWCRITATRAYYSISFDFVIMTEKAGMMTNKFCGDGNDSDQSHRSTFFQDWFRAVPSVVLTGYVR